MSLENRIAALQKLRAYIKENGEELKVVKRIAEHHNSWFTQKNIDLALNAVADEMLKENILLEWLENYEIKGKEAFKIGLILAGNIPLVGFHDILCVYLSGHLALIKASSKDSILTIHLIEQLQEIDKGASIQLNIVDNLKGMDAIIATGSNHSAKQFEQYFSKYPNIIRRNRNGIAILGEETSTRDILDLGRDIFQYFGLGCRNVSKIYLPLDFDKVKFMEILHEEYKELILHTKYKNNYDYNYALYLMNKEDFLANGALILRRHQDIVSRIACVHYEYYTDLSELEEKLEDQMDKIQCIASNLSLKKLGSVRLGNCQNPRIDDYADGVDTMEFLTGLNK